MCVCLCFIFFLVHVSFFVCVCVVCVCFVFLFLRCVCVCVFGSRFFRLCCVCLNFPVSLICLLFFVIDANFFVVHDTLVLGTWRTYVLTTDARTHSIERLHDAQPLSSHKSDREGQINPVLASLKEIQTRTVHSQRDDPNRDIRR